MLIRGIGILEPIPFVEEYREFAKFPGDSIGVSPVSVGNKTRLRPG